MRLNAPNSATARPTCLRFGGVLLGGGAGTLIGAFSRQDRWTVVPVNWLDGK